MPLSVAVLLLTLSQGGQDARAFYTEMQTRISQAQGFRMQYITGIDAWDSDVEIVYEKSGRFSKGLKNYSLRCDGNWFLELDLGEVTHRRAKPDEICYYPGFESIYPNHPPLAVFGTIEETKPAEWKFETLWKLRYMDGRTERALLIHPKTKLPAGGSLIPKGTPPQTWTVPGFRKQTDVVRQAAKALQGVKVLVLNRSFHPYGGVASNETILIFSGGLAYVEPERRGEPFPLVTVDNGRSFRWIGKSKPVPARSLDLPGFESITGAPVPKVSVESRLFGSRGFHRTAQSTSLFAWSVDYQRVDGRFQVLYRDPDFLPDCYNSYLGKAPVRTVTYGIHLVNPRIVVARKL